MKDQIPITKSVKERAEDLIQIFDPSVGGIGFGGPYRRFCHRMPDAEIAEIESVLPSLGFDLRMSRENAFHCVIDGVCDPDWCWFGWCRNRVDGLIDVVVFEVMDGKKLRERHEKEPIDGLWDL